MSDPAIEARIEDLLRQMTLAEKVGQLVQVTPAQIPDVEERISSGRIGSLLSINDPAAIERYERLARNSSRLGIPLIVGNDVIHGYRTVFPIPWPNLAPGIRSCSSARPPSRPPKPRPAGRTGSLRRWSTCAATHAGVASPKARARTRS